MSFDLTVRLIEAVRAIPAGTSVVVSVDGPADVGVAKTWADGTGNHVLAVHQDGIEIYRGRPTDAIAALPPERRPGYRLWLYTNFNCNLACDYCCVSSSPRADPRTVSVADTESIIDQAVAAGVHELYFTGGEPFLLLDLDERIAAATAALPTTVLTNGMVWTGKRLERLRQLPRHNLTLQISLDSTSAEGHDRHRGAGSFDRAMAGIHTAIDLGFRVRVAATLDTDTLSEEAKLTELFDKLDLADDQRVVRRVAHQGAANGGLVVSRASLIPEVCVTGEGVWWHPVAAIDPAMRVTDTWNPLASAIDQIKDEFRQHRLRNDLLAASFPCA